MREIRSRLLAGLALGVVLGGVVGAIVALLRTIDLVSALAVLVVGTVLWATVVIGIREAQNARTTYW